MSTQPYCHVCDSTIPKVEVYARRGRWTYVRCPACGLVFLHPVPDEAMLCAYYNDAYEVNFNRYVKGVRDRSRAILDELKEYFPKCGRLLEVGCSYGVFLAEAQHDGWEVKGVELSEAAARRARTQFGLNVFCGTLDDQLQQLGGLFDVVALFHVIEHLPKPVQMLEMCRKLTKPNGLLILKTPNVESIIARLTGAAWQWISPPAHLHLYSSSTLNSILRRANYEPLAFRSAQGDANNNLFAFVSSIARRALSRSEDKSYAHIRDNLYVRTVEATCELLYYPFRVSVDPWLGVRRKQPELFAIAQNGQ